MKHHALLPCSRRFLDPSHPAVRKSKIAHMKDDIERSHIVVVLAFSPAEVPAESHPQPPDM